MRRVRAWRSDVKPLSDRLVWAMADTFDFFGRHLKAPPRGPLTAERSPLGLQFPGVPTLIQEAHILFSAST
jgi:hypothetical protein